MQSYIVPMIAFAVIAILATAVCVYIVLATRTLAKENTLLRHAVVAIRPMDQAYLTGLLVWVAMRIRTEMGLQMSAEQSERFHELLVDSLNRVLITYQEAEFVQLRNQLEKEQQCQIPT